jgi:hypothetical protein
VLTLYHAEDLLTAAGCPACRYVAEASDRYLAWFALEGHGDAVTITRLCASLGMCPQHTRGLMRQPGAAIRLTAVYRYLLQSARAQLTGRAASLAPCPACARETAARDRALDTLVTGLGGDEIRGLYRELGGLCVPHVRAAAGLRARRQVIGWLTESMIFRLAGEPPSLAVLAGWPAGLMLTLARGHGCGHRFRPAAPRTRTSARSASPRPALSGTAWPGWPPARWMAGSAGQACARRMCTTPAPRRAATRPGRA